MFFSSVVSHMVARAKARPKRAHRRASNKVLLGCLLVGTSALVGCAGDITSPLSPFGATVGQDSEQDGPAAGGGGSGGKGPTIGVSGQPLDCKEPHLGATPLQRLSRTHYVNSLRDLLGVTVDESALPADEKFGVFDGNVVTPVSDLLVESYMLEAEVAARAAAPKLEAMVKCDRAKLGDAACAAQLIDTLGQRIYRRPLQDAERAAYVAQFAAFKATGYVEALRVVLETMLQSPNFLYRVELMPVTSKSSTSGEIEKLDAYELASRLSFFLVSSTPDDTLLTAAKSGELLTEDGLAAQAERLIADPRFADTVDAFHLQWLDLAGLDNVTKDTTLYPLYTPALAAAMRTETLKFANYVLREDDAKLGTLLTASYSFPEGPLLPLYGLKTGASTPGEPVALDPKQRAGLLTQPAFLTAHSHYNQSGPVQRGKVVIRNVLCQVLPDPPNNVDTTPPDPSPTLSTREQLLEHTVDKSCAGCHKRIDGIGFGFESFDAIGAFRASEAGKPVDASGEVLGTAATDGPFEGVPALSQKLVDSPEVQHCVTTQWVRFALGRMEADDDSCNIESLFKGFTGSDLDIRALLQSIALSDAFRSKRVSSVSAP
jgi:hypothetical protein